MNELMQAHLHKYVGPLISNSVATQCKIRNVCAPLHQLVACPCLDALYHIWINYSVIRTPEHMLAEKYITCVCICPLSCGLTLAPFTDTWLSWLAAKAGQIGTVRPYALHQRPYADWSVHIPCPFSVIAYIFTSNLRDKNIYIYALTQSQCSVHRNDWKSTKWQRITEMLSSIKLFRPPFEHTYRPTTSRSINAGQAAIALLRYLLSSWSMLNR